MPKLDILIAPCDHQNNVNVTKTNLFFLCFYEIWPKPFLFRQKQTLMGARQQSLKDEPSYVRKGIRNTFTDKRILESAPLLSNRVLKKEILKGSRHVACLVSI